MLSSVRYFFADVGHWLWSHKLLSGLVLVALALAGAGAYVIATDEDAPAGPAPAPQVVVAEVPAPEDARDLGFPEFATKNTTRVAGSDPVANAAGVALAVYPATGESPPPQAVTLVDAASWQTAVAASVLMAQPIGAPLLVTEGGDIPSLTESALAELDPRGSPDTDGTQVFVTPAAGEPGGDFESLAIEGSDPAVVAAEIARVREKLADEPEHILVTSSEAASYSMPAAAWAARSGDPVLFVGREGVPEATIETLRRNDGVPVYVLGPESAVSAQTMRQLARIAPSAQRVGAEGAVENAIAFARFADGSFGWNINDPGHGFVIANTERPLDAAIASPLSASGTWGPLLVTDDAAALPGPLRSYLLDLKPGYETDPTRALYNHVWLIGNASAVSVELQAEADELAEVAPISSGPGSEVTQPGEPESQPDEPQPDGGQQQQDSSDDR